MSEQQPQPGALDKLVRVNPVQVANFLFSAGVVRASISSAGESLVLLPERGSLPVYWAADGYGDEKRSVPAATRLTLPIGSYDFLAEDQTIKKGTLTSAHKQVLVGQHAGVLKEASRLLVLDEVQKGGTITELVNIVRNVRGTEAPNRIYVIAAQDSRKKVSEEPKKPDYTAMASGNKKGVAAVVVPMPLFTTDSDRLLNQLWYDGNERVPAEIVPTIEVRPNHEAEVIFRALGMAARNREALEDTSVIDSQVFSYPLGEKAAARVEQWREVFLNRLRSNVA